MPTSARYSLQPQRLFAVLRVTEVSAAGGRYSEPEEGKVTSNQEGIYAVAGCDDNFSGDRTPFCVGAYYVRPRENAVLPYRIYVCHSEECNDEESLGEIKYNGYSCTDKTERLFAYAQSDR